MASPIKSVIFIHAGLGNALLLLPLIKALKAENHRVTALVTSEWPCEELLRDATIFESIVVLRSNRERLAWSMRNVRKFDRAYLDFFAATRKNVVLAKAIATSVRTNHWPERNMPQFAKLNVLLTEPIPAIHEGLQNLRLHQPQATDADFSIEAFNYPGTAPSLAMLSGVVQKALGTAVNGDIIAVQVSAGNNQTPYKNWPQEDWAALIQLLAVRWPHVSILLLGDGNETEIGAYLAGKAPKQVVNLVGRTTIREVMALLNASTVYLGVDSGLMHMAVSLGKPTVSIWGASDPILFGYNTLDGNRHKVVRNRLFCQPCNAWIAPNTERVSDPLRCPDFKCIRSIAPATVMDAVDTLATDLSLF